MFLHLYFPIACKSYANELPSLVVFLLLKKSFDSLITIQQLKSVVFRSIQVVIFCLDDVSVDR